ncbi:MAG: lysophospholipid acyltransferase family protein [Candidatus Paceibacterota bacterium]|jgi:1-acyl-sn-glycerol-3-phosphate acyltransferase
MKDFLPPLLLQKIVWIPTRLFLIFFAKLEVRGLENLEGLKGKVVFVSNHSSELDPILLPAALPLFSPLSPIFYTSREKEFYERHSFLKWLFYREWFFEIWGAHQIQVGKHDYEKSLEKHKEILNSGGSLFIFPEGRKTTDGSILPAHGGAAYLARATGAPIVPTSIRGVFKIKLRDFLLRRAKIVLVFSAPIIPLSDDYKAEVQKVMDIIAKNL